MRPLLLAASLLLTVSCGSREPPADGTPPTPFGTVTQVGQYLTRIDPHVQAIGRLEAEVEAALSSERPGGEGRRGTGRNLAETASLARPQLQQVLEQFEAMDPPPLLAPFHRDVRKLILLRLEAYATISEGWEAERTGREFATIYDRAEGQLRDANRMIEQLNAQMAQINQSLQQAHVRAQAPAGAPAGGG